MKACTFLCILLFPLFTAAQTESYKNLLRQYNKSIREINQVVLDKDSLLGKGIIVNNANIYMKFLDLDSNIAKSYMADQSIFLDSFKIQLNDNHLPDSLKKLYLKSYYDATVWYNTQYLNVGLDRCSECFLVRKISATVMKRVENGQLDTIKCATIEYMKVLPNARSNKQMNMLSYPCPEYEQQLATGPNYEFVVKYNGKTYGFKKPINVGSTKTDIQKLSFIID